MSFKFTLEFASVISGNKDVFDGENIFSGKEGEKCFINDVTL